MADKEFKITGGPSKDALIGGIFFGTVDHYAFVVDGESVEATITMIGPGDKERDTFHLTLSVYATGRWYAGRYNAHTRKGKLTLQPQRTVWYRAFKEGTSASMTLIADADGIARDEYCGKTYEYVVDAAEPVEGPNGMLVRVFSSHEAAENASREHIAEWTRTSAERRRQTT